MRLGEKMKIDKPRCYGNFEDDRSCDLCFLISPILYKTCREVSEKIMLEKLEYDNKIKYILDNCPHRGTAWQARTEFDSCTLKGKGTGRSADSCYVSLDCMQYCKKEKS